jgi:hypothetical protein
MALGGVRTEGGGHMRLEDYCNSGPRGSGHQYTAGILFAEEELMAVELGERVANAVVEKSVDGWDALMDLHYAEFCAREGS